MNYLTQIDELQKLLNDKIEELANNIVEEQRKSAVMGEERVVEKSVVKVVQPLQCTNCGAGLKIFSSDLAEREYCGMKYTMANCLEMLRTSIKKPSSHCVMVVPFKFSSFKFTGLRILRVVCV
ncbi:MAG: hypothetical protein QXN87_08875 [Candidatus Bathyarchaeia archaeon]